MRTRLTARFTSLEVWQARGCAHISPGGADEETTHACPLFDVQTTNSFYAFETETSTWYIETEMHHRRGRTRLVEAYECLYALSRSKRSERSDTTPPIEEYSIEPGQWTVLDLNYQNIGRLPERFGCFFLENEIVVISDLFPTRGGWTGEEYAEEWTNKRRIRFLEVNADFSVFGFRAFGAVTVPL